MPVVQQLAAANGGSTQCTSAGDSVDLQWYSVALHRDACMIKRLTSLCILQDKV